jgi:hypothetical protein
MRAYLTGSGYNNLHRRANSTILLYIDSLSKPHIALS